MPAVYRDMAADDARNRQIVDDVLAALHRGRNCLVLTRWTKHLEHLDTALRERGHDPVILRGGMGAKARNATLDRMTNPPDGTPLLAVATGSYIGEGFDCPALDTIFLAAPVAFKGPLEQYVGRDPSPPPRQGHRRSARLLRRCSPEFSPHRSPNGHPGTCASASPTQDGDSSPFRVPPWHRQSTPVAASRRVPWGPRPQLIISSAQGVVSALLAQYSRANPVPGPSSRTAGATDMQHRRRRRHSSRRRPRCTRYSSGIRSSADPDSGRPPLALQLVLHVCCTRPDLAMFGA